jgi:2-succinyl-5-enolpyruvyl-6-hydroxy-3-cyclohexene-1-carboxylate synthase
MSVAAATMCATLIDEWIRLGVCHAVVAPGSRSTPIVLALAERAATGEIAVQVAHDERVAGFMALGLGLRGVPALLVCTSGTAAANFAPAVVEAGLSDVPMLVLTADRPPELRDVGAAQTVDQTHLFGRSVRWFHDPGVADLAVSQTWRSLARRAMNACLTGPVHINLPFREPLVAASEPLPSPLLNDAQLAVLPAPSVRSAWISPSSVPNSVPSAAHSPHGLILAGGRSGISSSEIRELAARTGWPILADPLSEARQIPGAICAADQILRSAEFVASIDVQVIVRIGRPSASKVLAQWVASCGATVIQVGGPQVVDPDHRVAARCAMSDLLTANWQFTPDTKWWERWSQVEAIAQTWIDEAIGGQSTLSEPALARLFAMHVPEEVQEVVVASSMPIRDLEWFGGPSARAHANRGANGIDGTLSTALGVACGGVSTAVLIGDIAFLHDQNALVGLMDRTVGDQPVDLRIVVVDNDGGGIFSFLPQAEHLAPDTFEQFFGTPHKADLVALAQAYGVPAQTVETAYELIEALKVPGPRVIRVQTDRSTNPTLHSSITAAVTKAIAEAVSS